MSRNALSIESMAAPLDPRPSAQRRVLLTGDFDGDLEVLSDQSRFASGSARAGVDVGAPNSGAWNNREVWSDNATRTPWPEPVVGSCPASTRGLCRIRRR